MPSVGKPKKYSKITGGKAAAVLSAAALFAVVLSLSAWFLFRQYDESVKLETRYDALIDRAARDNGVDPDLVKAVIWRESKFKRSRRGDKGEIGLMQIMPKFAAVEWAKEKKRPVPSEAALFDPELNIEIGTWFLSRALKRWNKYREKIALALCEYNAGFSRANAWKPDSPDGAMIDRIKISSTGAYVRDILRQYEKYRRERAQKER